MARSKKVSKSGERVAKLKRDTGRVSVPSPDNALFTLIADEAAPNGIAPWRIWARALAAIQRGTLPVIAFDQRGLIPPLPPAQSGLPIQNVDFDTKGPSHGKSWRDAIASDLSFVAVNRTTPPTFAHRYSFIFVDDDQFQEALDLPKPIKRVRGRAKPGPKSHRVEMRQTFEALYATGPAPPTKKAAHRAVLQHLGVGLEPARGYSYDVFLKATKNCEL